jgi:hypothetical protein
MSAETETRTTPVPVRSLEAVLNFQPGDWEADHTIHFSGEGVTLIENGCFIPFVSKSMQIGDRIEFRIETPGVWGNRLCGGGRIVGDPTFEGGAGVPGIRIEFLFLDPQCHEAVVNSRLPRLSFPRA